MRCRPRLILVAVAWLGVDVASALDTPSCKDGKGRKVVFVSEPSESGMANAHAEYRRDCDAAGRCRQTPIVVYNPKHPYFIDSVMARFSLRHECGHHVNGDPLRKPDPNEPIEAFIAREAKADCYAATRGKKEGVLSCKSLRAIAATLADAGRISEEKRAVKLGQCAKRLGCR